MHSLTYEQILRDYSISGLAPGWYFKRSRASSGKYQIECASLGGNHFSMTGDNLDGLLKDCVIQAGYWYGPVDSLTGLFNRKRFDSDLTVILQSHSGIHLPLSVVYMDMDHFKETNDQLGHVVGDQVLSLVGKMLMTIGSIHGATIYRVAGDEFTAILTHTTKKKIQAFIRDIQKGMENMEIADELKMKKKPYTLTSGIAITTDGNISVEQIVTLADKNLYKNKRKVRSKTVVIPE